MAMYNGNRVEVQGYRNVSQHQQMAVVSFPDDDEDPTGTCLVDPGKLTDFAATDYPLPTRP